MKGSPFTAIGKFDQCQAVKGNANKIFYPGRKLSYSIIHGIGLSEEYHWIENIVDATLHLLKNSPLYKAQRVKK